MKNASPSLDERHRLTFEQAEGVEPLPSQLRPSEISTKLRNYVWMAVYYWMNEYAKHTHLGGILLTGPWVKATRLLSLDYYDQPADEYKKEFVPWKNRFKQAFMTGDHIEFYGTLQAICRAIGDDLPELPEIIADTLESHQSGYRLIDQRTLYPLASPEEARTIEQAAEALRQSGRDGALKHLHSAAEEMSQGNFAGAVREAIHSVESVAVWIEPQAKTLHDAIARLEKKKRIHPSLKKGFSAIYGYTSDEKGVRHALVEGRETNVSESEAQFMIGACAAFVSYLVNLELDTDSPANASDEHTSDEGKR